jgi:hypothetical protein
VEVRASGEAKRMQSLDGTPSCSVAFEGASAALRKAGVLRYARCGDCILQLISPASSAIDAMAAALRADPTMLLCNDPMCKPCTTTAALLRADQGAA